MSEEDYQRGLRGGPARVTTGDWERWSDWKAGNRAYERAQELSLLQLQLENGTYDTSISVAEQAPSERQRIITAASAAAREAACQVAVATVKFGIEHSELIWEQV